MISTSASLVNPTPSILVVEDNDEDFELLQRSLRRSPTPIPIQRCVTGDQALELLHQKSGYVAENALRPNLILLDLTLPGIDGREVLRRIKQNERLRIIPVVVFTASDNPSDIEECYQYRVNSYIVKSIDSEQLKQNVQLLINYWLEVTTLPDYPED